MQSHFGDESLTISLVDGRLKAKASCLRSEKQIGQLFLGSASGSRIWGDVSSNPGSVKSKCILAWTA